MFVHLYGVLVESPCVLDDGNSHKSSDTGQQQKKHARYAKLVAHLSPGCHILLATYGVVKKKEDNCG